MSGLLICAWYFETNSFLYQYQRQMFSIVNKQYLKSWEQLETHRTEEKRMFQY